MCCISSAQAKLDVEVAVQQIAGRKDSAAVCGGIMAAAAGRWALFTQTGLVAALN